MYCIPLPVKTMVKMTTGQDGEKFLMFVLKILSNGAPLNSASIPDANHGAGIFTYIYPKHERFL